MQDLICPSWRAPRGMVLLAAGSGRRMQPLTDRCPKALLEVGEHTVLDWMLHALLTRSAGEVVVVTGHAAEQVEAHLCQQYGSRVRCVRNPRYAEDVNIASVECGVAALKHPERGYLIAETDLLLDDEAWDHLFATLEVTSESLWACRGVYGPTLTGGTVRARLNGSIEAVDYRPVHDAACDGWPKMLGMLAVGPREVAADRALRRAAMAESIAQYYLAPWRDHLSQLPCRVMSVDVGLAATFNTPAEFDRASQAFLATMALVA